MWDGMSTAPGRWARPPSVPISHGERPSSSSAVRMFRVDLAGTASARHRAVDFCAGRLRQGSEPLRPGGLRFVGGGPARPVGTLGQVHAQSTGWLPLGGTHGGAYTRRDQGSSSD
eukprot:scaffold699_cov385-Prasinococcus_capsulatus_cf.AAC.32